MNTGTLYQLSAFSNHPQGGNPAGVWIGDQLPSHTQMQQIAANLGFSETAFVAPSTGKSRTIRYYSPLAEVDFCGHATIATGVALGKVTGEGTYHLQTNVGEIPVLVQQQQEMTTATLTSIEPQYRPVPESLLHDALAYLDWHPAELDPQIPPALAFAGNWHLVLATNSKARLDQLHYAFEPLKALMLKHQLITLQLIWKESETLYHSRNPFPVGGVVEDPATGAAAAALGGYLREAGLIQAPHQFEILQGEMMGRPSQIHVRIPQSGGIQVSGTAVSLTAG